MTLNLSGLSWKTSTTGLTMLASGVVILYTGIKENTLTVKNCTESFGLIAGGLGLCVARDNNRSSEQVGAGGIPKQSDPVPPVPTDQPPKNVAQT